MLYLLAQDTQYDKGILDVLVLPVGLTLLAGLIFYSGWWVENRLTKAPWKWIAFLPVGYALYVGWGDFQDINEPVYRAAVAAGGAKKMIVAHWAALIIPILGIIGIILFHFFNHKLNLPTDD